MILSVNSAEKVVPINYSIKKTKSQQSNNLPQNSAQKDIQGIPRGYVSFRKAEESKLHLTDDAQRLLESAKLIAKTYHHKEILPQHIIQAELDITRFNIENLGDETLDSGSVEYVSSLNHMANDYSKTNLVASAKNRKFLNAVLDNLEEDNRKLLEQTEVDEEYQEEPKLSKHIESNLQKLVGQVPAINAYVLLATAINTLTSEGNLYASDFLKSLVSFAAYKNSDDIKKSYMKAYDAKAIDAWNKLALGSNMIITYTNPKEVDRMTASIIKTMNQPKYGNFNSKNTLLYAMSENINDKLLLQELVNLKDIYPEKRKIIMVDMGNLIANSVKGKHDELEIFTNLFSIIGNSDDNLKLMLFQDKESYYQLKGEPSFAPFYNNMVTYAIPQIQTYEARAMLNKKMLQNVKTPFTKEAKDRAIYHASNINGIFPDKAVDLMKRISEYYGDSRKKITSKDVDEFAQIGYELFSNNDNNKSSIIYDTGKTLDTLYGKETTKKDVEAIIRQIKTGIIGTRGIIISSKDNEAGSGRRYTAETIAGEAKIPFVAIDAAEFATSERDTDGLIVDTPKKQMNQIFAEAKNAARQNQYKTAIVYVNNFEELAFSSPYLPGYKQAMSQLTKEMQKAVQEDVSILVIASTDEDYAPLIPVYVRGFNQSLSVDSPAFNKRARKEVLVNKINEVRLPLAYKTAEEKDAIMDRLVKLTEYMSFVEIKSLVDKTNQIMYERNKQKVSIGDFIEAYLQLVTGRTSRPEMPEFNKRATTSHECGHATNLEVMNDILKRKGKPWHQFRNVNFITLDPRGGFLGAVFEDRADNTDYPFEAMFTGLVCSYGGYSCEKLFFGMDGSSGISQDLAQASSAAKRGIEYFGFGFNTGKVSNAAKIQSSTFSEKVYKDMDVILTNAKVASDLITETYKKFNEWFTQKYSKLIGTDDCMVDGEVFRKLLSNWKKSLTIDKKEEVNIMEDMIMDIIDCSKKGIKYGHLKK